MFAQSSWLRFALLLTVAGALAAHNGAPFPMISDRPMGPCLVSLWTHPDVGNGTFYVVPTAALGRSIPPDVRFAIGVRPKNGGVPERLYPTSARNEEGSVRYYAFVPFDREGPWQVHLYMRSAVWSGKTSGEVNVGPAGPGSWDLLFLCAPVLAVGSLWFFAKRRTKRTKLVPHG